MPFLQFLLIYIATFLLTELLRPKPRLEDAKPANLGDFNVPTATEGRVVPIIWGRVKLSGPNIVWYGDLEADPITQKVKTGLFSSTRQTIGFNYSIGLQLALCRGRVDRLINVRNDSAFCWGEDAPSGDTPIVPTDGGATFNIDEPEFFGGEETGGGGLVGECRIYPGSETQSVDNYLDNFQTPETPAYRGTCHIVMEELEIGQAPQLRPFEFELERITESDGLDLATFNPGALNVNDGANPMNVVFECLNNDEWGLAIAAGQIDVAAMRTVAGTLSTEGNGFRWIWDRPQDVLATIRLIEEQVDGVFFQDPITGQYSFRLIRFDYTPGTLPLLDESNVRALMRFQRPAWEETQNQVQAEFVDPRKNYTQSFALAQDMGNQAIQGAMKASKVRFPGVKDKQIANDLAWRELRQLSFPAASATVEVDRSQYAVVPGDVLELSWARFGIVRLPMRVTKVDRGRILQNRIKLDMTQDIFSSNPGSYTEPIDTGWAPIDPTAQPSFKERLWEVPWQISLDNERHLGVICSRNGGLHIAFDVFADLTGGTTFTLQSEEGDFTPTAEIDGALSRDIGDVNPYVGDVTIDTLNDTSLAKIAALGSTTIDPNNPENLILVDEEVMWFESAIDGGGGQVTLQNVHRGALDTIPANHADNATVWFIGVGLGLLQRAGPLPDPPGPVNVKIVTKTIRDVLDLSSAATLGATVLDRIDHPIPPGDPSLNGNRFVDEDGWPETGGTLRFTWNTRNRATQDFDTKQDDASVTPAAGVGVHLVVRRVDNSAIVIELEDVAGVTIIRTGWVPESSPGVPAELDYTAELSTQRLTDEEGQIAISEAFEIVGYGITFGSDYGGLPPNLGTVSSQGDPPVDIDVP